MGMPSMPELIIILVIIIVLFGAKKIPDLAQGLGKGIKNFKKAMSEDEVEQKEEDKITKEASTTKTEAKSSETKKEDINT